MEKIKEQRDMLIDGLCILAGLQKGMVKAYAKEHDILHLLDHPASMNIGEKACKKIMLLKDFINAYQYFRRNEAENREGIYTSEKAKEYFISQLAFYREKEDI